MIVSVFKVGNWTSLAFQITQLHLLHLLPPRALHWLQHSLIKGSYRLSWHVLQRYIYTNYMYEVYCTLQFRSYVYNTVKMKDFAKVRSLLKFAIQCLKSNNCDKTWYEQYITCTWGLLSFSFLPNVFPVRYLDVKVFVKVSTAQSFNGGFQRYDARNTCRTSANVSLVILDF